MRKLHVNHLHAHRWMIVDNFAGGGGASTGIEMAIGRSPDVAINHNSEALAMHKANHSETRHYATDVFEIDPQVVVRGRAVGLAWFSPDCTQFSKAKGGKPIREAGKKSRGLAWVVVKWAKITRPRVIMLENVEEFQQWGPLIKTERGAVPCPARRGKTFKKWVRALQQLGYVVDWKELRACDYGTPTIRKRLFLIARCDGKRIVWPKPTHGKPGSPEVENGSRLPWLTAASIIDWSLPCPSIFLTPAEAKVIGVIRPLAENTMNRIAAGLKRYVLNCAKPFIVTCNHGGNWFRGRSIDQPMATVTGSKGDAVVTPFVQAYHGPTHDGTVSRSTEMDSPVRTLDTQNRYGVVAPFAVPRYSERDGQQPRSMSVDQPATTIVPTGNGASLVAPLMTYAQHGGTCRDAADPLHTVTASRKDQNSLVQAFLAQHNTGVVGHAATKPVSTITGRGTQQQIVEASSLSHNYTSNTNGGEGNPETPLKTVVAGGQHHMQVKAFLQKYYGSGGQHQDCREPMHTVPTKDRLGIVTVEDVDYEIVDIGMRMLTSRELFRAQGFPESYKINVLAPNKQGKLRPLPKDAQVRMCGNSVCPQLSAALVRANCPWLREPKSTTKRERQMEFAGV